MQLQKQTTTKNISQTEKKQNPPIPEKKQKLVVHKNTNDFREKQIDL